MLYFEQSKLKLLNFCTDDICNITRRSHHGQSESPKTLYDISPFRLAERKDSCRLSTTVKRQMGRSGVMACSSVRYESMKFYETGQATDPL